MNRRPHDTKDFTEEEIARRHDAALLRALSTPHKLHSEMKIGKHKAEASPEEASKPPKNGKRTVR